MEIFIASMGVDYEGTKIIGVYSTKEKAIAVCDNDVDARGNANGDYHVIEAFDIDGNATSTTYKTDGIWESPMYHEERNK